MSAAMAFVTDCDGTLVHYNTTIDSVDDARIVKLEASSSGKVGLVSQQTLDLLDEIVAGGMTITCASGMRVNTMLTRFLSFPSIKYWILENGGRIFERDDTQDPAIMRELNEWKSVAENDDASAAAMAEFKESLQNQEGYLRDFVVDDFGYETMVRIKATQSHRDKVRTLAAIRDVVPARLLTTMNLGYLDVCYPHSGKLSATRWLLERTKQGAAFDYMGDDDNDVEIGAAARHLFVTCPHSDAMAQLVSAREKDGSVTVAPHAGAKGTEALLARIKRTHSETSSELSTQEGTEQLTLA